MSGQSNEKAQVYLAEYRYVPFGTEALPDGYFVAVVRRPLARRATDICRHQHASIAKAEACAARLIELRLSPGVTR